MAEPITRNAYAILGVTPDSDDGAIVAAYRTLARRYHPDIAGEAATERMTLLNAAFDRLRTPERRAEYDLELERSGLPVPSRAVQSRSPDASPAAGPLASRRASTSTAPWAPDRDGTGGAGPPPGRASGSVLGFGRHVGWSIGEIARIDPGYLVWLEDRREGRPYAEEIDRTLRATGYRVDRDDPSPRGKRRR